MSWQSAVNTLCASMSSLHHPQGQRTPLVCTAGLFCRPQCAIAPLERAGSYSAQHKEPSQSASLQWLNHQQCLCISIRHSPHSNLLRAVGVIVYHYMGLGVSPKYFQKLLFYMCELHIFNEAPSHLRYQATFHQSSWLLPRCTACVP